MNCIKNQLTHHRLKLSFSILVCSFILAAFFSCHKDCVKPTGINSEWIWEKSESPWGTLTPLNTGEQRKLKIDDYIFREFINDSLVFESQYDLVMRNDSIYDNQTFIVFPSGYEEGIIINGSELVRIEVLWSDGFNHYYDRNE